MGFTVTDMEGVEPGDRFVRGSTQDADCINCPYSRLGRPSDPVTGEGPANPHWIIVAESPGRNEVVQQRPMVGTSGRLVQEALAKINVRREDVWLTNAILCPPIMAAEDAAEDLKRVARKACSSRLRRELAERPGLPVLTLGAHAAQELTGDARLSITQMAGACYDVDVDGTGPRVVIPSVHPASILRGGSGGGRGSGGGGHTVDLAFWNLLYDASKVNLLARGADIRFTEDIQIEITDAVRAQRLVEDFVADARRLGTFACDTETYVDDPKAQTALAPINAQLSAIGLATTERAISIAWAICYPDVLAPLDALFADAAVTKVFHNAIYDVPVLERHGFVIAGAIHDTLLMHHNAFPGLAHNLQRVTTQFYAAAPWKSEYRLGKGDPAALLKYNALDTLATARIEGPIYAIVKRSQAEQTYEVDLAMAHAARVMHVQGVPIHRDTNEHLRRGFRVNVDRSRAALLAIADQPELRARFEEQLAFEQARKARKHDPEDFDTRLAARLDEIRAKPFKFLLDSGDHVAAFLKASNVPLALQTASGRISTRKDVLEEYVAYPEVRALLTYRENAKLLSTFVERMFTRTYAAGRVVGGFADAGDRIHPRWSVHKITGRWGSEGPVCFDGETEILTPQGWVRFDQLSQGAEVAQFCPATDAISFVKPLDQFAKPHVGEMVRIVGRYTDLCVTPDHRLLIERRSGRREDVQAHAYVPHGERYLLHAGQFTFGATAWTADALTLLCAAQADGWWQTSGWCFGLTKSRKIERLTGALTRLGLEFSTTQKTEPHPFKPGQERTQVRFYVHRCPLGDQIHALLGPAKVYGAWLLDFTRAAVERFIDELVFWDGNFTRGGEFFSSDRRNADWIQAVLALAGRRSMLYAYTGSPLQTRPNWQVRFQPRTRSTTTTTTTTRAAWDALVYCVTVPTAYVVVRRNGCVVIAGNCQNWPKADKKKGRPNLRSQVIAPPGRALVAFDAQQLEARLIALMSGDPFLLDIFHKQKDIHSEFARLVWPDFDSIPVDERKIRRDIIKRPEYCVAPGTRVLTRDLRWVAIETLAPGDDLVGFDASRAGEPFRETYFRPSTVLASKRIRQPCYRIVTTKGTVIASDEHLWVGWKRSLGHPGRQKKLFLPKNWIRTDALRAGDVLTFTAQPWTPDTTSWAAGYLAGVYDGEGHASAGRVGFAQNPGEVLATTQQLLGQYGFNWLEHHSQKMRIVRTEIKGGLWESLRFLGVIRPVRLLPKAAHVWENRRLRGKGDSAEVLAVEFIGDHDVIALSTSTETYIAEGFLSHNCSFYGGSVETSWKAVVRDYPNVTLAMIQRMVTLMQTRMRGVTAWHQHMLRAADRDGEIRSMFLGRRRAFPIKQFDLSEVVNFPIQSSGADLINMGLRDIMPRLPATAFPILQIHDAVVFECAEDDQDLVKALVVDAFTREATYNGNTLLFPVDARAGKSWAEVN